MSAAGLFTYVSAGLPRCFGVAGAFNTNELKRKIDDGLPSVAWSNTIDPGDERIPPILGRRRGLLFVKLPLKMLHTRTLSELPERKVQ